MVVSPVTTNTQRILKIFFGLYLKLFIHLYANFQIELLPPDWMINDKKLAGFALGGWLMGIFNNRLLFYPLFPVNFFRGQGHDGGGQSRIGFSPVPHWGILIGTVNMTTPLKYYKSKIFKNLTYVSVNSNWVLSPRKPLGIRSKELPWGSRFYFESWTRIRQWSGFCGKFKPC